MFVDISAFWRHSQTFFPMPPLSRKRGWKKSNPHSDPSSANSTQKSQPSTQSLETVLRNANITLSGGGPFELSE